MAARRRANASYARPATGAAPAGAHQSSASRFPAEAPGRVPAGDKGNVENVFKVRASTDSVRFLINDVVVATRPRAEVGVDGIVGFRINHSLSVHVAALTVAKGK